MELNTLSGILRCTSKYRKLFGLPDRLPEPSRPSASALGDWYANTLSVGHHRFLHYTSELSRLAVVIPLGPRNTGERRFVTLLAEVLVHLGVPRSLAERECATLNGFTYARATNRSVLGTMRDQGFAVRADLEHGFARSPLDLALWLAETPTGPLNYAMPERVAPRLVQDASQRS